MSYITIKGPGYKTDIWRNTFLYKYTRQDNKFICVMMTILYIQYRISITKPNQGSIRQYAVHRAKLHVVSNHIGHGDCSFVRRFICPKVHLSEGSSVRRFICPKVSCPKITNNFKNEISMNKNK